jgi:hypothetical protein
MVKCHVTSLEANMTLGAAADKRLAMSTADQKQALVYICCNLRCVNLDVKSN